MSATEVIQQIESMPPEEQRKVFSYLQEHVMGTPSGRAGAASVSEDFKAAADEVFALNTEMFRKLAQ